MDISDNDILISAYLDGELTADETRRVEELLATSAEARQLVDELRAIRAGLKQLPQHKLGPDFAADVMRRLAAESQESGVRGQESSPPHPLTPSPVHAQDAHSSLPKGEGAEPADPHHVKVRLSRFWRNPRSIGWSAVAIAVAVMIMVTSRRIDRNREADSPQGEREVARAPQTMEPAPNLIVENQHAQVGDATKQAPPSSPGQQSYRAEREKLQDATGSITADAPARMGLQGESGSAAVPHELPLNQPSGANVAANETAPPSPKNAESLPRMADKLAASKENSGDLKAPAASAPAGTPAPPLVARDEREGIHVEEKAAGDWMRRNLADDADLVVVEVEMSPEAAQRGEFAKLLAKNEIVLEEAGRAGSNVAHDDAISGKFKGYFDQRVADPLAEQNKADAGKVADNKQELSREGKSQAQSRGDDNTEVFLIDALPQQIDGTIAALAQSPDSFSGISIRGKKEVADRKPVRAQNGFQLDGGPMARPQATTGGPRELAASAGQNQNGAGQLQPEARQQVGGSRPEPSDEAKKQIAEQKSDGNEKKELAQPGRARRLSRIDVGGTTNLSIAEDQKAKDASHESLDSRKLDATTRQADENKPAGPVADLERDRAKMAEQTPLAAPAKEASQPAPSASRATGGAGGFGGGAPRATGGRGITTGGGQGGRFAAPTGGGSARSEITKSFADSSDHRQQAVFVLRIVPSPTTAAAAAAPTTSSERQSESATTSPAVAAPAKPAENGK